MKLTASRNGYGVSLTLPGVTKLQSSRKRALERMLRDDLDAHFQHKGTRLPVPDTTKYTYEL